MRGNYFSLSWRREGRLVAPERSGGGGEVFVFILRL
jgi:hypothetical protein